MPTRPAEPDLFPVDLLDRDDWASDSDCRWWALYTRSRCEKELMRRLRALEVPFYGPTIEKRFRSPGGRICKSFLPLFPNYVFVYGDPGQRYAALTTNCVSRDIAVADAADLANDLRQLRQVIQTGRSIMPESRIEPGERVRIRFGPLAGQEGIILRRRGETRLLVAVRFLQQGASVQLDECDVEGLA
jgi:transcription antitermination factor NusG